MDNNVILKHVTKMFGKTAAVKDFNLEIPNNSFVSLLGPSGCGKTTTLRMIAGLETPTSGEIWIGGKKVFSASEGIDVSPNERNIGFLFQNYALWPHMTVYKNISFGLENMKWNKADIDKKVNEMSTLLRLDGMLDRYPSELSGGQQQRVAIARTLATNPRIILMDEPLSNLDAKLRLEMRSELKRLHQTTGATFIYVTHDQTEAMALSTKICLMNTAVVQQYATPLDIYERPVNTFVADFVGSPSINFIDFNIIGESGKLFAESHDSRFELVLNEGEAKSIIDKTVTIGIRPEDIRIGEHGSLQGVVQSSFPYGMETTVIINSLDQNMRAVVFGTVDYQPQQKLRISFNQKSVTIFDKDSHNLLGVGMLSEC